MGEAREAGGACGAGKACGATQGKSAEIDQAFIAMEEQLHKTECLVNALYDILVNDLTNEKVAGVDPNTLSQTVTSVCGRQTEKLTNINIRLNNLVGALEEQVGQIKIITP